MDELLSKAKAIVVAYGISNEAAVAALGLVLDELRPMDDQLRAENERLKRDREALRKAAQTIPQSWVDENKRFRAALEDIAGTNGREAASPRAVAANALESASSSATVSTTDG
jgi:FtsZ-binding cell division protein ZapB